jgi:hypothetical protein
MSKKCVNCGVCSEQLSSIRSLRRHVQKKHSGRAKFDNIYCVLCDYAPKIKSIMDNHILAVHLGVKKWKCMLCYFSTGESGSLAKHVKSVHLKEDDYKCQLCDVTFSSITSLNVDIKAVHEKIKGNKCSRCDYATAQSANLTQHVRAAETRNVHIVTMQLPRKVIFPHMSRQFTTISETTNVDPHCDYSSSQLRALKAHIKAIHEIIRDMKCPHCNYAGASANTLKRHMRRCSAKITQM